MTLCADKNLAQRGLKRKMGISKIKYGVSRICPRICVNFLEGLSVFRLISKTLFFLFLSITIPTLSHARALQQTTTLEEEIIRESMLTPDKMPNEISSHEGIRTRLLIGMPVYFPKEWEEKERKIEPNWIIEALTETAVKLENLPSRIEFPNNLKDKIRYDPSRKLLILKWVISEKEK